MKTAIPQEFRSYRRIIRGGLHMLEKDSARELISFIQKATSPYHVVEESIAF
jgi:hypothetical protein